MTEFLLGPVFFFLSLGTLFLGLGLLAFLIRTGWVLVAFGVLGLGFAVPGVLTVVAVVGCVGCFGVFLLWRKRGWGQGL